jgi:hypothetical protein
MEDTSDKNKGHLYVIKTGFHTPLYKGEITLEDIVDVDPIDFTFSSIRYVL